MENTKKRNFLLIVALAITIIAAITTLYLRFSRSSEKLNIKILEEVKKEEAILTRQNNDFYDYSKMLNLVKEEKVVENKFYTNYQDFVQDKKNLDQMKEMLQELRNEKSNYRRHLQKIRAFHKRTISSKRKSSLRYYQRVIEESIDDLRSMISKFKISLNNLSKRLT